MSSSDHALRQFIVAARSPSLRKAAEGLDVSQPALSKQIQRLEEQFGFALFRRHGRGITLTAQGAALLARLEPAFEQIDHAVTDAGRALTGQLRISSVNTLAAYMLPKLSFEFMLRAPDATLGLMTASSEDVVESIVRGTADMGLVYELAVDSEQLERVMLHDEMLVGYRRIDAALPRELHVTQLAAERLLLPPRPYVLRRIVERECGRALQPVIESNSLELILDLAAAGCGMGILPARIGDASVLPRGLERVTVLGARFERKVVAIRRRGVRNPLIDTAVAIASALA